MKILGTGLSGLIGSRIVELLASSHTFEEISRSTGVDITDYTVLSESVKNSDASVILHLAAKANVEGCEEDKVLGEEGEAWKINVVGTENIVKAAQKYSKKVIYISTDFVFDGEKPVGESYSEEDAPNPVNWYAKTKYEGEKRVQDGQVPFIIIRPAYPYRANFTKNDFVRGMLAAMKEGKPLKGITDHVFCPTFIDDMSHALDALIAHEASGIYHVVGSQALTPYEATTMIGTVFGIDPQIEKTTRADFFANRAQRPYNLSLKNDKISKLGVTMKSFEEGLEELKRQISSQ
jgi:dTDP-4-dehydrorhamnose reductase